jgi:hypothetical protein
LSGCTNVTTTTTLPEPTLCCQLPTPSCADIPASQAAAACAATVIGTLYVSGAICGPSGNCGVPDCCQLGGGCLQGQGNGSSCTSPPASGTLHPGSQCLPSGECARVLPYTCCSLGGGMCVYTDSPTICSSPDSLGGSTGAPGTVCDGATGACVSTAPAPGNCCPFLGGGGAHIATCVVGSGITQSACSGTIQTSKLCGPTNSLSQSCM